MGAESTSLLDRARGIFTELGYQITTEGSELRAERKWRTVHVTAQPPKEAATYGQLRCFVATSDSAPSVIEQLREIEPDYDWAVISVTEDEYTVLHPSADVLPAP